MKKYDVYGIGNALVDMEFQVEDSFYEENGIDKGLMTLVDEERQNTLMNVIDQSKAKMKSGGSAANSIIAVSQFGGKGYYSCKVADDALGDFYLNDLKAAGVNSNLANGKRSSGITGKCLVMITPDAERTMNTFLGITADFSEQELDQQALKDSKYLYIEGYLVASPTGFNAMMAAKKIAEDNGVKTALTFSDPNMITFFRENMDSVVGAGLDLLFCNEEEAKTFTGKDNLFEAREELKKSARTFAITLGKNGAIIYDGDTFIDIEPYNVQALDTNGAGDMFAGAFLYGLTHENSYAQSGKIASLASSKIVSQYGPRLEWHQAKEILNHVFE
ncbi:MAG: adenosine kinase [Saprospiraceae bacterium]|nr:adenosine kinase [Saprospiraceae bacterium]